MDHHKADGLCHLRVGPRFTNQPLVEGAPIKRLVLGPYRRENIVGTEVFSRQRGKPECDIRQSAMALSKVLVGDKAGWINDDFAGIEFRCMSSEHFGRLAWQFKRVSGSFGLKVQAAIAC